MEGVRGADEGEGGRQERVRGEGKRGEGIVGQERTGKGKRGEEIVRQERMGEGKEIRARGEGCREQTLAREVGRRRG